MRAVDFGSPSGDADFARWVTEALREIERASNEDISEVADAFTMNGSFTETRVLNVTSPTAANLAAVLATLISDIKRRGTKRDF